MVTQGRYIGKIAALIAGGAAVGAGLALLFAPQSGSETRRMIRYHAQKAQLETSRLARRVQEGVKRVKDVVSKQVPEIKAA